MRLLVIPRRQINIVKGEIFAVIETLMKGEAMQGESLELFERKFAKYIGVKYAFALSSGRAALRIILKVLDLPIGSEVMIPAYTDESVPWAIIHEGLKPVFLEVKGEDGNIDTKEIEHNLNKNTKAIIATHLFGNICDIEEILKICDSHKIVVIEDCAHAPGLTYRGKKTGSFGRLSYFSFSSAKHFNSYGGGCLLTNDDALAGKIRLLLYPCKTVSLKYLIKELACTWIIAAVAYPVVFTFIVWPVLLLCSIFTKNDVLIKVYNKILKKEHNKKLDIKRLTNLQARIALMKLSLLEQENKRRRDNVIVLRENLSQKILDLEMKPREGSNYYFYILKVKDKDILSRRLLWVGIDTGKFLMRNAAALCKDKKPYPVTEWLCENSLQIPVYSPLNKKDMLRISMALNSTIPCGNPKDDL